MNMIFENGAVSSDFRKALIKPLYKKDEKSEFGNYRGISLISVDRNLFLDLGYL